jgi:hypothetical protein
MFLRSGKLLLILITCCAGCGTGATQARPSPTPVHTPVAEPAAISHPATATPGSVSPTRTPTPPPGPRDFTETFDTGLPYWAFLQIDNGLPAAAPQTRDGFLIFDLPAPNQWAYALYGGHAYSDVTVETEIQSRTGGDGAAGIICRYDEKKGWYELNIYEDQTYQLLFGQWLAAGIARYTPLYRGQADVIQNDYNALGLECRGNMLTPFINGVQMRRWQELKFALQSGLIGLTVASFDDSPFTIAFDSLKISEP